MTGANGVPGSRPVEPRYPGGGGGGGGGGRVNQRSPGGRDKGKGHGGGPNLYAPMVPDYVRPPQIMVNHLAIGEVVDVFHRYARDPNGYFMVDHAASGSIHPSIGRTDGWTTAKVAENWDINRYDVNDFRSWVLIQWLHPTWYNRRGGRLDVNTPSMVTQRVMPEQIRLKQWPSEANEQPCLTLFNVRWGGEQTVNPVTEGAGGWGQIGSTPSDNYINGLEDQIFNTLGPTYEIISAFVQNSEELRKINAPLVRHLMKGRHFGALYFLWPISYQDGHEFPAYVDRSKLFELIINVEASGIPTRFPHSSHLYKIFASKEWTAQMCLHPLLRVPLTTQVAKQSVVYDPSKAATVALNALQRLSEARASFNEQLGFPLDQCKVWPVNKGVAKLGWSWEALDVSSWRNKQELSNALSNLSDQPGSQVDLLFVQEWVEFDVEMRHFVVEPNLKDPESLKPKKIIYTVFKCRDQGSFRDFDRYNRESCIQTCFKNDEAAMADAEAQAEVLIARWLQWFQAQSHEMPTVIRFDIMAKRTGPGTANIMTGELTELGGCFLGWPQGPQVVFGAMIRSFFKEPLQN